MDGSLQFSPWPHQHSGDHRNWLGKRGPTSGKPNFTGLGDAHDHRDGSSVLFTLWAWFGWSLARLVILFGPYGGWFHRLGDLANWQEGSFRFIDIGTVGAGFRSRTSGQLSLGHSPNPCVRRAVGGDFGKGSGKRGRLRIFTDPNSMGSFHALCCIGWNEYDCPSVFDRLLGWCLRTFLPFWLFGVRRRSSCGARDATRIGGSWGVPDHRSISWGIRLGSGIARSHVFFRCLRRGIV